MRIRRSVGEGMERESETKATDKDQRLAMLS